MRIYTIYDRDALYVCICMYQYGTASLVSSCIRTYMAFLWLTGFLRQGFPLAEPRCQQTHSFYLYIPFCVCKCSLIFMCLVCLLCTSEAKWWKSPPQLYTHVLHYIDCAANQRFDWAITHVTICHFQVIFWLLYCVHGYQEVVRCRNTHKVLRLLYSIELLSSGCSLKFTPLPIIYIYMFVLKQLLSIYTHFLSRVP